MIWLILDLTLTQMYGYDLVDSSSNHFKPQAAKRMFFKSDLYAFCPLNSAEKIVSDIF